MSNIENKSQSFYSIDYAVKDDTQGRNVYNEKSLAKLKDKYDLMNHNLFDDGRYGGYNDFIKCQQDEYDRWFLYRLRDLPVYEIAEFLNHHFNSYSGDKSIFLTYIEFGVLGNTELSHPFLSYLNLTLQWIKDKKRLLEIELPSLEKSKKLRKNKPKEDWANATALFMRLMLMNEKNNFLTCDKGNMAEAFSILSGYEASYLQNILGRLNSDSFTSADFDDKDISNLKKAVKAMSDNLALFIKSIQDKK